MLSEILNERGVPPLKSREEMLHIMQNEVYGFLPPAPESLTFDVTVNTITNFCAGKAVCNKIVANCVIGGKEFSFPFYASLPTNGKKHPFFVHINFRDNIPDLYLPVEEVIDSGFAVLSFCYKDITTDDRDFTNGIAGVLYENSKRESNDAGKIAMWAWAAQRVLDYAYKNPEIFDLERAAVCGHSRLGKTALFVGAMDERFKFVYSNDSGCSGAAITRNKQGETVEAIYKNFPYWFCENYQKYVNNESNMPFDQHYLAASVAPRKLLIGSASNDLWADPESEMLCCVAASSTFQNGFKCEDRLPQSGDKFFEGDIGYHLREGNHYFSREDWQRLIEFVNLHSK